MAPPNLSEWRKLPVSLTELCINTTLRCGQSFRWRKSPTGEWSCTLHGRLLTLKQDATHLHYRAIFPSSGSYLQPSRRPTHDLPTPSSSPAHSTTPTDGPAEDTLHLINHYLNLTTNLTALYAQWSAKDANFRRKVLADMDNLQGIRILKQDPWEALCGFICSSNNNIKRISLMMNRLCTHFGPLICELEEDVEVLDDDLENTPPATPLKDSKAGLKRRMKKVKVAYHDFPPPEALTGPDVEATLRRLGFGYRAKYIAQTAHVLVHEKGGLSWLHALVNPSPPLLVETSRAEVPRGGRDGYKAAHAALLELTGVGPKVADCVCLMGLGWGEAVPVDTHVWQIAVRDYGFKGGKGGMSKALYEAVGDKFRRFWGLEAGWCHSVLFTADLREFSRKKVLVTENDEGIFVKTEEVDENDVVKEEMRVIKDKVKAAGNAKGWGRKTLTVQELVKRPLEDESPTTVDPLHEDMMSRIKRRRRGGG